MSDEIIKAVTTFEGGHSHEILLRIVNLANGRFIFGCTTSVIFEDGSVIKGHTHSLNEFLSSGKLIVSEGLNPETLQIHNHEVIL